MDWVFPAIVDINFDSERQKPKFYMWASRRLQSCTTDFDQSCILLFKSYSESFRWIYQEMAGKSKIFLEKPKNAQ
jgi:hypothetical protein